MTSGPAEIHKGLYGLWAAEGLDWICKQHWNESDRTRYPALSDTAAAPGCSFPYVVYRLDDSDVTARMTGYAIHQKRANQDVPLTLSIFAKQLPSGEYSAKQICGLVLDRLLEVFGGHPDVRPRQMTFDYSQHLLTQYVSGYGLALDDDVYGYVLNYLLCIDTPVMA